jgi:hypothetical protein
MRRIVAGSLFAGLTAALLMAATVPVFAADMVVKAPRAVIGDRCAKVEPLPGTPAVPGGDLFGITSGTDIGDPCSWAMAVEFTGRAGKRDGRYLAVSEKTQFTYTYNDRFAFAFSPFITHNNWANVTVAQDALADIGIAATSLNRTQFDGFSGEVFYRALARGPNQPVAVTLSMEPRWARVDGLTGWRADAYGNEFKLFLDVALNDNLYAAMNLNYALARARYDVPGAEWTDSSGTSVSAALTARLFARDNAPIEAVYVGAEARLLSAFTGLTLNQNVGNGFFFGPTLAVACSTWCGRHSFQVRPSRPAHRARSTSTISNGTSSA